MKYIFCKNRGDTGNKRLYRKTIFNCTAVMMVIYLLAVSLAGCADSAQIKCPETSLSNEDTVTTQIATSTASLETALQIPLSDQIKNKYNFALIYGGPYPVFDQWAAGAQMAAKELNIPEPIVTCPVEWDQNAQNDIVDNLVADGVSGIGIFLSDVVAGNEEISLLSEAGINVIALGVSPAIPTEAEFCYAINAGFNDYIHFEPEYESQEYVMQTLVEEMKLQGKKQGNIVILCSSLADKSTMQRWNAFKDVLEDPGNTGFTLFKELADTDSPEAAKEAIEAMFSTYINEVDGIICTSYINSQALGQAMIERESSEDVVAITVGTSPEVLEAIDKGYLYGTMTQSSFGMGYAGIYALKYLADGYVWKEDAPYFLDSGSWLLKKEELAEYEKKQEQIAKDFVAMMMEEYFDPPVA